MNSISNIWNHPKTTVAGLLIAVGTVAGVLSQQGVSLGHAGSGTMVALVGSLATALLGLLAKDPGAGTNVSTVQAPATSGKKNVVTLGVWALIALLLPLPFASGCSQASVAQDIVNWTPALQSAVVTVDSTAALLAPADAPVFTAATVGFDAASNLLSNQAKAYLANPSAGTLAQIQNQVVVFEQQVNAALLQAAKIVDPASQKHALAAVQAVSAIVNVLLALVQSISSNAAVAGMAARSTVKLAAVRDDLDRGEMARIIAAHYGETLVGARAQVDLGERELLLAGF